MKLKAHLAHWTPGWFWRAMRACGLPAKLPPTKARASAFFSLHTL